MESYKKRSSDLIHHYAHYDLSLKREAYLRRDSSVDSRRKTTMVDFGVERHTLVIEKIIQVFHHSSTTIIECSTARAHSSRVRAQLQRGFLVDLSHPGRIPRFLSDPFERRKRNIFFLFRH